MRQLFILIGFLTLAAPLPAPAQDTFSIVAVDSFTGEVGSAGASCLGIDVSLISDVHPGVGAINTQALYIPSNQDYARELLDSGKSPQDVIDILVANDVQGAPQVRQYGIAVLANGGTSAGWTGTGCTDYKGHRLGKDYAIQGNILLGSLVLDSMEARFLRATGNLADRLMYALHGANVSGADTRCAQYGTSSLSAFIRVAKPGDDPNGLWLDLRATIPDGSKEPIDSLQTIYNEWRGSGVAYDGGASAAATLEIIPNPAHTSATILYTILSRSPVRLTIYDILGRRLATPLAATQEGGGHSVTLATEGLLPGDYYCRLDVGAWCLTRRLVVGQ